MGGLQGLKSRLRAAGVTGAAPDKMPASGHLSSSLVFFLHILKK